MTLDPGRVQAVFLAALEEDTLAHRVAVLDRECASDDELRRRVQALLIAHDEPDRLLDRPLLDVAGPIAALRARPADTDDEVEPSATDPESPA
jgi:eukaryotic-like serine/threonine-protein kinase